MYAGYFCGERTLCIKMTGENRSAINQYEEDQSAKLWRKMKEAPFVPLGE